MKGPSFSSKLACLVALIVSTAALVCAAVPEPAEETTNAEPKQAKPGVSFKLDFGKETSGGTNFYGLPKEAFDRLSPEQIVDLAKSHEPPGEVIGILTVSMFAMIVACVALGVTQRLKRTRTLHETLRLMIEKGQPIPPELLQSPDGLRRPRNDLRNGLVCIGIGLGVGVLLLVQRDGDWPLALIPLLIGVALLVAWKLERKPNGQPR
jgi:hypothetical protein